MSKSENAALATGDDQFYDQYNLLDWVAFIRRNLGILLGAALIGGVLGWALAFVLPAKWEANALIRVGQLGNAGVANPIEPPLQVVDRLKNTSFQNDVLRSLGVDTGEDDADAKLFRDTLKVKLEKSELLNLTLRGRSPDDARLNMGAIVNELKAIHLRMSVPTTDRWQQELALIESELKHAKTEAEQLTKSLGAGAALLNDQNFPQAALLSNILIAREGELRSFRERKLVLEEQLSPERTFATDVLGRLQVSTDPVFPKKPLFAVAGLFMGLLLGVLLSILRPVASRGGASIKSDLD